VKVVDLTVDDDYVTNGVVVEGHVANLTTREFLVLLRFLAQDVGLEDTIEAYFRHGSRRLGEWGDDPTGEYLHLFASPTTGSPVTHYCDDECTEDCDQDGEEVWPVNTRPATAWFIDWDRYLRWVERGAR
jgi:hypothetical protein